MSDLKQWIVKGYVMVPHQVEMHVSSRDEVGARLAAMEKFGRARNRRSSWIIPNSEDMAFATDFDPLEAEEVQP